jgi:hypothetical protein
MHWFDCLEDPPGVFFGGRRAAASRCSPGLGRGLKLKNRTSGRNENLGTQLKWPPLQAIVLDRERLAKTPVSITPYFIFAQDVDRSPRNVATANADR